MNNTLHIVGAGPGNPDFLTVKADRVLRQADVVLYDALMGTEILEILSEKCEKIYVGKTYNDNQDQEERIHRINRLMKESFLAGKKVVRLKTGDSLIFGRGIEEIRFLKAEGINYELIPGITAGIAAANNCEIPITERSVNRTLLFCTGTTLDGDLKQFDAVAHMIKLGTPVMMYMGLKNIENIISRLIDTGVCPSTSICAVSKVSFPDEKMITGTLTNFVEVLANNVMPTPTIIMIGKSIAPMS